VKVTTQLYLAPSFRRKELYHHYHKPTHGFYWDYFILLYFTLLYYIILSLGGG